MLQQMANYTDIYLQKEAVTIQTTEPPWAKNVQPIVVLGRGIPAHSRTLGRWAYCIAGKGMDEKWYRLYPFLLVGKSRSFEAFDIIKPFITRKNDDGRPESCRINPHLVWKTGTLQNTERLEYLKQRVEVGSFMHNDSWRTKTLGIIRPSLVKFSIGRDATVNYYCDHQECNGHTTTFFDILQIERNGKRLIAPVEALSNALSEINEEKLRFVVGTLRQHQPCWIIVETLICLNNSIESLQSWLISKMELNTIS